MEMLGSLRDDRRRGCSVALDVLDVWGLLVHKSQSESASAFGVHLAGLPCQVEAGDHAAITVQADLSGPEGVAALEILRSGHVQAAHVNTTFLSLLLENRTTFCDWADVAENVCIVRG